jgi:protein TonB
MTSRFASYGPAFKRALAVSGILHAALLAVIIANPRLPKSSPKGVIHYINLGGSGGIRGSAGPRGGTQPEIGPTPIKKDTLRDLTTVQKLEARKTAETEYRYPVDKPKRTSKKPPVKKAAISKPDPKAKSGAGEAAAKPGTKPAEGGAGEGGTGLSFGPPGAEGEGAGFGGTGDPGLSSFPYNWYLQELQNRIGSNWNPAVVEIGAGVRLRTWVHFRINRDGSTSAVEVKGSSGIRAFDNNAVRAITDARPFPPLPKDYEGEYLAINLQFEHVR